MAKQTSKNKTVQTPQSELTPPQTPPIVGEIVRLMQSATGEDPVLRVTKAVLNHKTFKSAQLSNYQTALMIRIKSRLESDTSRTPTATLIKVALEEACDLQSTISKRQSRNAKHQDRNIPGIRIVSPVVPPDLS